MNRKHPKKSKKKFGNFSYCSVGKATKQINELDAEKDQYLDAPKKYGRAQKNKIKIGIP